MSTLKQYLIILLITVCCAWFVRKIYRDLKLRCESLVQRWLEKNEIQANPKDISIDLFAQGLPATVLGIGKDGIRKEYLLKLGGFWRGSTLDEAKVLKILWVSQVDD